MEHEHEYGYESKKNLIPKKMRVWKAMTDQGREDCSINNNHYRLVKRRCQIVSQMIYASWIFFLILSYDKWLKENLNESKMKRKNIALLCLRLR